MNTSNNCFTTPNLPYSPPFFSSATVPRLVPAAPPNPMPMPTAMDPPPGGKSGHLATVSSWLWLWLWWSW